MSHDDSSTNKMFVSLQPQGNATEKVYDTLSTQALEEKPLNTQSTRKVRKKEKLYRHRWQSLISRCSQQIYPQATDRK